MHVGRASSSATLLLALAACAPSASVNRPSPVASPPGRPPNILLVITDDQGYGDLGATGNPVIRTPHIDRLARDGVTLSRFHVCPVCSPTRSTLLTGRYNYRTGVVDTFAGRSMMHGDEVTLAERLDAAGYRTGIFGKWHLGDDYPMRPMDQGFGESLVHRGGGIGQQADPPGNHYMDPVLQHNGRTEPAHGYCSDVFTDAAIRFVEAGGDRPFFAYLAYNCPHTPLEVPDAWVVPHRGTDFAGPLFPKVGRPPQGPVPAEDTARVYAMVENIDANVGRLLARLDAAGLAQNTIVIFLTDNGPQQPRWNAGLRGQKGSVYEGGTHVPCFVRWPAALPAGRAVDAVAAHIDIVPTLLEACGAPREGGPALDGRSLLPLLRGEPAAWPERTIFFQWHRGDVPEIDRACAALGPRWKLVQPQGAWQEWKPPAGGPRFELYDLAADPYEEHDAAEAHPDVVARMRAEYEAWFRDVSATRGYAPPRIALGAPQENPVTLTQQDWRGAKHGWGPKDVGWWEVEIVRGGTYDIALRFPAADGARTARFAAAGKTAETTVPAGAAACAFQGVDLPAGPTRLEAWLEDGTARRGAGYVDVERRER